MKPRFLIAAVLSSLLLALLWGPKPKDRAPNTAETNALGAIAASITRFEETHERTPRDWRELTSDSEPKFLIDDITPQTRPSLRYELFSPPLELEDSAHQKLKVVAMTRKPMWEALPYYRGLYTRTTGPGRYLIFKATDHPAYRAGWFSENAVLAMWPAAGRDLPAPDQEPARSWWHAQEWGKNWQLYPYFAAFFGGIWMIWRWGHRQANRMSEI